MTKMFDQAVERVRRLPQERQDEIAKMVLSLVAGSDPPEVIDPDHLVDVLEGLAQARRREFATAEDIAAAFRRFDG